MLCSAQGLSLILIIAALLNSIADETPVGPSMSDGVPPGKL
jgi:hypothetical protein